MRREAGERKEGGGRGEETAAPCIPSLDSTLILAVRSRLLPLSGQPISREKGAFVSILARLLGRLHSG